MKNNWGGGWFGNLGDFKDDWKNLAFYMTISKDEFLNGNIIIFGK